MKKVEIYTSPICHYCQVIKEYFQENNIEYIEHNIKTDRTAFKRLLSMKVTTVPYVLVDGVGVSVVNSDMSKVKELLGECYGNKNNIKS